MDVLRIRLVIALACSSVAFSAGCGGGGDDDESDGDADTDADTDADGDTDADSDADADADADGDSDEPACAPTDERRGEITVTALPDDAYPVIDFLDSATTSIKLSIYQLSWDGPIHDKLVEKAEDGLDVAVLMDDADQNDSRQEQMQEALLAAGVHFKYQPPEFNYFHAKYVVVDEERAWLGTGNLVEYFMDRERNFDIFDDDWQDVEDLLEIFDADWNRRSPDLSCTRLLVAPENARERLLDFIDSAQESLIVESMQLGDDDVREHLADRMEAGVDVRILLAHPCWIDSNAEAAAFTEQYDIPTHFLAYPDVHVKMMLADDRIAYLGSINLSWNSIENNRETGVLVWDADAIETVASTFEDDWGQSDSDWSYFANGAHCQ